MPIMIKLVSSTLLLIGLLCLVKTSQGNCPPVIIANLTVVTNSTFVDRQEPFLVWIYIDEGVPVTFEISIWKDELLTFNTTVERDDPCASYPLTSVELEVHETGWHHIRVRASNSISSLEEELAIHSLDSLELNPISFVVVENTSVDIHVEYPLFPRSTRPSHIFVQRETALGPPENMPGVLSSGLSTFLMEYPIDFGVAYEEGSLDWVRWKVAQSLMDTNDTTDWYYTFPSNGTYPVEIGDIYLQKLPSRHDNLVESMASLLKDEPILISEDIAFIVLDEPLNANSTLRLNFTNDDCPPIDIHDLTIETDYTNQQITIQITMYTDEGFSVNTFMINVVRNGSFITDTLIERNASCTPYYMGIYEHCTQSAITNLIAEVNSSYVVPEEPFAVSIHIGEGAPVKLEVSILRNGTVVSGVTVPASSCMQPNDTLVDLNVPGAGIYTVRIEASNSISSLLYQLDVTSQYEVDRLEIDPVPPIMVEGYPVTVNVSYVIRPISPRPTQLFIRYRSSLGNLNLIEDHSDWDPTWPLVDSNNRSWFVRIWDESEAPAGIHTLDVWAWNNVSTLYDTVQIKIITRFSGVAIESESGCPSLPDQPAEVYPVEFPVYFTCSIEEGLIEWVTWEIEDLVISNTTLCSWSYRFPFSGTYNVTAVVSNILLRTHAALELTMAGSVTDVLLVNNGPVLWEEDVIFVIFAGTLGNDSSFSLSFGDGHGQEIIDFSTNSSIHEFLKPGLLLPFDPTKQYSKIVRHRYLWEGSYSAEAHGWNLVSSVSSTSESRVNLKSCTIPLLHIRSGSPDFLSAPKLHRNRPLVLHADIRVDCHGSDVTRYHWRVFRIDEEFPYPGIDNEVIFDDSIRTDLVECYIPAFTLVYGDYIAEVTVTAIMKKEESVGMIEYDQSYFKVVPNLLVPIITGGSLIQISWYSKVTLDASASYDPDLPRTNEPDTDLMYRWFCRKTSESYPQFGNDSRWMCTGCGCFDSGFILTSDTLPGIIVSSSLTIPAQIMEGNKSYHFLLYLIKPGRIGVVKTLSIDVLAGNVTQVMIRCVINCDLYMNPSERLVLSGKCEECTEFTRPRYEWSVTAESGDTDVVTWSRDTTTGRNNAYVAFKGGIFSQGSMLKYTIKLTMHSWAGTTSHAALDIQINLPPSNGTCFIAPTQGFVLFTYFYISCSMFVDEDTPLSYQIRAINQHSATTSHIQDYSQGSLLFFGMDPVFPPVMLPLGMPSNDFQVNIAVFVSDAFGASVVIHLNVTVQEPVAEEPEEMFNKLVNLTQGENSEMAHLLESGDTHAATQLISTVSSILNSETEKQEDDMGEEDEVKKEARIQVREQLITSLQEVEIRDLEELQQTSAAVIEVTKEEDEISVTAQVSASAIYHKMGNFLQEQSEAGATTVAIEGTARRLVSGVATLMAAATNEFAESNVTATTEGNVSSPGTDDSTAVSSRQVALTSINTLKKIGAAILHNKVPGEDTIVIKTDEVELLLKRLEKWEIDGSLFEVPEKEVFIKLPTTFREAVDIGRNASYDEILDTQVHHFSKNPYPWSRERQVTSEVTSIEIIQGQSDPLEVNDLEESVNIFLGNTIDKQSVTLEGNFDLTTNEMLFAFNVTEANTHILIHFEAEHKFDDERVAYLNVTITDVPPRNVTELDGDWSGGNRSSEGLDAGGTWFTVGLPSGTIPYFERSEATNITGDPYNILLDRGMLVEEGTYYMSVQVDGGNGWAEDWNLTVVILTPWCAFWDESSDQWISHGCQPGPLTDLSRTHCICDHLSTFAGGYIPLPNALNLREDILLFSEIFENPVTAATVLCVILVFSLCAYWARKKDKREQSENEVIDLADNDGEAQYQYHVTVITGDRRSAGTSSVVTLTLHGTHGSSKPHVLAAPHRPVLQRSGHDSFIIAVPQSLGQLTAIRLWHDNSGSHPHWYISRVVIHDAQSDGWWYFLCHSWLGLDINDGCIDRTFGVATQEDLTEFHHLFMSGMQRDIKDQHLWVSVIVCPPKSNFTRLQRTACCLCIVLTAMLASIIFYGVPEEYATADSNLSFGSLTLSWSSIVIGIESSIITFPINYLICEFFRKARTRPSQLSTDPLISSQSSSLDVITWNTALSRVSSLYERCQLFSSSGPSSGVITPEEIHDGSGDPGELSVSDDGSIVFEGIHNTEVTFAPEREGSLSTDEWSSSGEEVALEDIGMKETNRDRDPIEQDILSTDDTAVSVKQSLDHQESTCDIGIEVHPKFSDSSGYITGSQAGRGPHSSDSMALLLPRSSAEEPAETTRERVFYGSHDQYLQMKLNQLRHEFDALPEMDSSDRREIHKMIRKLNRILMIHGWSHGDENREANEGDMPAEEYKEVKGCLPWWSIYISWGLVISTCTVCSFFIILYGLKYGKQQSLDWLTSMFVSLIQSVAITQPFKVVVMSALIAIILPSHTHDQIGLWNAHIVNARPVDTSTGLSAGADYYRPPSSKRVEEARKKRIGQAKMYSILKAFLGQAAFIFLVLEVAYLQRDPNTFLMKQALMNSFTEEADEVGTSEDMMEWLREVYIPALYGGRQDGFMLENFAYRIGEVRLRQLRVKEELCPSFMGKLFSSCEDGFDRGIYGSSWVPGDTGADLDTPWSYQTADVLQGSRTNQMSSQSSDAGGYVLPLGPSIQSSLDQLDYVEEAGWIDDRTKAVFIEWNVFNPNTNLLCICCILFERHPTGDYGVTVEFDLLRLLDLNSTFSRISLGLESIYIVVILVMIMIEVRKYQKRRSAYWGFWNVLTLFIIMLSLIAAVIYVLWLTTTWRGLQAFLADPQRFHSFFKAALLNRTFNYTVAAIVFLASLKFSKILQFNLSIQVMQRTYYFLVRKYKFALTVILVVFFSFSLLAHMLFQATILNFSTFVYTLEVMFLFVSGGFDQFLEVTEIHPFVGAFFFSVLMLVLICLFMNLMIMFIVNSFQLAMESCRGEEDHRDIVGAFVNWLFSCLGIGGQKGDRQRLPSEANYPLRL